MPESESATINDYIEDYRDLEISFDTMHYKELDKVDLNSESTEKIVLLSDSILEKYRTDLEDIVETKTLTAKEHLRYDCNPWALSFDLYGNVEYWHLLLDLNNMYSITEFTRDKIKVYDSTLPDVIGTILALEEESINQNIDEVEDRENEVNIDDYEESDSDDDIEEIGTDFEDDEETE